MTAPPLEISSHDLAVVIDPGRGADVLSLTDRRTGLDVLFRSPWRERADAIRGGQQPSTYDPVAGWLEQYRGGWQTLCPNGGEPRSVHGAPVGFHGEASVVPWVAQVVTPSEARLWVELFSVPIRISRHVEVQGRRITLRDTITNVTGIPLELDYSSHPAFGGPFLEGSCRVDTGARRFTSDPGRSTILGRGSEHAWPWAVDCHGERLDLGEVPAPGTARELFGWLDDFSEHWAAVTNVDLGLTVRIEWDGEHLPYAWLWQELNATRAFPWYGRARAIAIEPASMQTSGPARRSAMRLAGNASVDVAVSVGLEDWSL